MNLILAVLALAGALDSTRVHGTALAMASGHPLAGVQVSLGTASSVTDSTGSFTLTVPAGTRPAFRFEWGGQSGTVAAPALDLAAPVQAILDTERTDLAPQVDAADWRLAGVWGIAGVFARRASGFGTFYTRDDFRRAGVQNLTDLLATVGMTHGCVRSDAQCGPVVYHFGQRNLLGVWVDGVLQTNEYADSLPLADVAAVEYYPPRPTDRAPRVDARWVHYTRYFLEEPYRGSMVIVWTRGYDRSIRR